MLYYTSRLYSRWYEATLVFSQYNKKAWPNEYIAQACLEYSTNELILANYSYFRQVA